jgi:hypothetical protein
VLVKGSLAAPTTFLLPWLIRSSLADGGRVRRGVASEPTGMQLQQCAVVVCVSKGQDLVCVDPAQASHSTQAAGPAAAAGAGAGMLCLFTHHTRRGDTTKSWDVVHAGWPCGCGRCGW